MTSEPNQPYRPSYGPGAEPASPQPVAPPAVAQAPAEPGSGDAASGTAGEGDGSSGLGVLLGIAMIVSAFLPWLTLSATDPEMKLSGIGRASTTASGAGLAQHVWNQAATPVGWLIVAVGVVVIGCSVVGARASGVRALGLLIAYVGLGWFAYEYWDGGALPNVTGKDQNVFEEALSFGYGYWIAVGASIAAFVTGPDAEDA